MKKTLLLLTAIICLCSISQAGAITPQEAKDHVGEVTTVTGSVDGFKSLPRETFLNMGGQYPNHAFTVFCLTKTGITASKLQPFAGKVIAVTGKIVLYRGKPEIVLNSLSQISPQ